ncbi:MAG: hypothetical protein F6K17_39175, partial [Okeania sp. SIO3C4]|nr:hypothetical protein [Okeania sp. SIO3C4]
PVAALMEKVAGLITGKIVELFNPNISKIGILVGPGHNGGDALVIVRELYFQGYGIIVYCPIPKLKELTDAHSKYLQSLGVDFSEYLLYFNTLVKNVVEVKIKLASFIKKMRAKCL